PPFRAEVFDGGCDFAAQSQRPVLLPLVRSHIYRVHGRSHEASARRGAGFRRPSQVHTYSLRFYLTVPRSRCYRSCRCRSCLRFASLPGRSLERSGPYISRAVFDDGVTERNLAVASNSDLAFTPHTKNCRGLDGGIHEFILMPAARTNCRTTPNCNQPCLSEFPSSSRCR